MVWRSFHSVLGNPSNVVPTTPGSQNRLGLEPFSERWKSRFQFGLASWHAPAYELGWHLDAIETVDQLTSNHDGMSHCQ